MKARLKQAVEWPLLHGAAFERLGLTAPRGVLLHGPPGLRSVVRLVHNPEACDTLAQQENILSMCHLSCRPLGVVALILSSKLSVLPPYRRGLFSDSVCQSASYTTRRTPRHKLHAAYSQYKSKCCVVNDGSGYRKPAYGLFWQSMVPPAPHHSLCVQTS